MPDIHRRFVVVEYHYRRKRKRFPFDYGALHESYAKPTAEPFRMGVRSNARSLWDLNAKYNLILADTGVIFMGLGWGGDTIKKSLELKKIIRLKSVAETDRGRPTG